MQPDVRCARARGQGTARECLQLISFALGVVAKGCSFAFRTAEQSTPEGVRTDYLTDAIRIDFKILFRADCPRQLKSEPGAVATG
jgi:hypothetical protein